MFAIVKHMQITRLPDLKRAVAETSASIREELLDTLPAGGRVERDRLRAIAKADRAELWRSEGARNCAQWLSAVFHVSNWKARRWVDAAHALESLPHTAAALESGALSLDKVCELTRFATKEAERDLITWARRVSTARIRERADQEARRDERDAEAVSKGRGLECDWCDDYLRVATMFTAERGVVVMEAVDRVANELAAYPEDMELAQRLGFDHFEPSIEQRRADALYLLVTGGATSSGKLVEPTVVVHAPLEALTEDEGSGDIGGATLHPETLRRLTCDCNLQVVIEKGGVPVGIGRAAHDPPRWLRRLVLRRDGHRCAFPGCEHKRFLYLHHVVHWTRGGTTDYDNLITLCHTHHDLVHEHRWSVTLDTHYRAVWFRPSGRTYDPGAPPPEPIAEREAEPPTYAEAAGYSRLLGLVAVL